MIKFRTTILAVLLVPSFSWADRPWEGVSDPLIMSSAFQKNFKDLPLQGKVKYRNRFWSGDYWADRHGSINYRWYAHNKVGLNLDSPTKEEAMAMSIPELAALAPSEKYDLLTGRYDYPFTKLVSKEADPKALLWEGICHGWAPASMNHEEPRPRYIINRDGIKIPFGSSDIKALLSWYYAYGFQTSTTHQMGLRCEDAGENCDQDLNAGAFHIVLANKVGIEKTGFVADIQPSKEVWNNPIMAYSSRVTGEFKPMRTSAPGTMKVIRIQTEIKFPENGENRWQTVLGTEYQVIDKRSYEYDLDIDPWGNIIGGEWRSASRPDFLWLKKRPWRFEAPLDRLGELVSD